MGKEIKKPVKPTVIDYNNHDEGQVGVDVSHYTKTQQEEIDRLIKGKLRK